jgi:hypothetical protein
MGQTYTQLSGNPPLLDTVNLVVTLLPFHDWFFNHVNRRLANCPLAQPTTYFFNSSTGSDTNDGLDPYGFNLSGASWNPATQTLTKTGAFASFTPLTNQLNTASLAPAVYIDPIYIKAGTGITPGLYSIASKTSNDAIVLATSIGASSASDVTSSNGPFQTVAKFTSLFAAAPTTVLTRYAFNRGFVGETTAPTAPANKNQWTISDYGLTGKIPYISGFTIKYNSAGWTNVAGNLWKRVEANNIGWVRYVNDRLGTVYVRQTTSATVQANTNSWWYDSAGTDPNSGGQATLFINTGATGPNNYNLEACLVNESPPGVNACDKWRIQNMRFDGYGVDSTQQAYGLQIQLTALQEGCLVNCEAYYTGYHSIGALSAGGATAGPIITCIGCKCGYAMPFGTPTPFVGYSTPSGSEFIWLDCACLYGGLPTAAWYPGQLRKGQSFFSHAGASAVHALVIWWNCSTEDNLFGCDTTIGFDPTVMPAATTLDQVRCFVVNENVLGFQLALPPINNTNAANINSEYQLRPIASVNSFGENGASGWVIQNNIVVDWINNTAGTQSIANQGTTNNVHIWHTHFEGRNCYGSWSWISVSLNPATAGPLGEMYNSVFSGRGQFTNACIPNFVNSSANLGGNAYFGCTARTGTGGYSNDPASVDTDRRPLVGSSPDKSSPLFQAGVNLPGGYRLDSDRNWNRRNLSLPPTIGPIAEATPLTLPTRPTGIVTVLSSTSFQVAITADAGTINSLYYRALGASSDTLAGTVTGSGTITVTGLSPGNYISWIVSANGQIYSLPQINLATLPGGAGSATPPTSGPMISRDQRIGEIRQHFIDFGPQPEFALSGQAISQVLAFVMDAGLSAWVDSTQVQQIPPYLPVINGSRILFWIQGNAAGQFKVTGKIQTSAGAQLVETGILRIF